MSLLNTLGAIFTLARPHQWAKNALVWTALFTAHRYHDALALQQTLLAFLAFCAAASAVYAFNDSLDVEADRAHPSKSKRPLASGALPRWSGPALSLLYLGVAAGFASTLGARFQGVLLSYLLASLAYCLVIKKILLMDVMVLAGLYVLRIAAGAAAINVPLSFWLLSFGLFLFFSLALLKRVIELKELSTASLGRNQRAYQAEDLPMLSMLGISAMLAAAVVLVMYLHSPDVRVLYQHSARLSLLLPIVLYGLSRLWLLALRGGMAADPVVHALRDPISYLCLAGALGVVIIAV